MKLKQQCLCAFALLACSGTVWSQATSVPGKPFEYLESLSQSAAPTVVVTDATGAPVGTYLGVDYANQRALVGLSAGVEGEKISFIVGADQSGFTGHTVSWQFVYPWVLGTEASTVRNACYYVPLDRWQAEWQLGTSDCGQALVAYYEAASPCDQEAYLILYSNSQLLALGDFFTTVIISPPGATIVEVGVETEIDALRYDSYSRTTVMFTSNLGPSGENICDLTAYIPATGGSYPKVNVYSTDILGNLYDTFTPPFDLHIE